MDNEESDIFNIKEYIEEREFTVPEPIKGADGRRASADNEERLTDLIQEKFVIEAPDANTRSWYDFRYKDFYVNIKITDPNKPTADNLNSKEGIYLALTGEVYEGKNDWNSFFKKLSENIKETSQDYYFLVIFKGNTTDVLLTSLKRLECLTPNGNNLPFQANWNSNRRIVNRTFEDAKNFILSALYESVKKRANILQEFEKNMKEHLNIS